VAAAGDWAQAIKPGPGHLDQFPVVAASVALNALFLPHVAAVLGVRRPRAGAAIEKRGRTSLGLLKRDHDVVWARRRLSGSHQFARSLFGWQQNARLLLTDGVSAAWACRAASGLILLSLKFGVHVLITLTVQESAA
jgi:hypothetical protein